MENELVNVQEVGKILGISRATIFKLIKKGVIKPIYYGKRILRFDKKEIIDFARHGLTQEVQN